MRRVLFAWAICMLGCSWGTVSPDDFKKEFGISPNANSKPEVNVFSGYGINQCLAKLRAAVGATDIQATDLALYPTYMSLTARSPVHPENVDSYECRYGEVGPSKPVKLTSSQEATLDQDSFALSEIDFDGLPARLDHALSELGLEGGVLSRVGIQKAGPSDGRHVVVTVYVTGTRKNGSIEYDGKGKKLIPAAGSAPAAALTRANLATAALPLDKWTVLTGPEVVAFQSFDVLAELDWAKGLAAAWKPDAALYYLRVDHPAADGTVDLTSSWCEYWFVSPGCVAASQGRCGFNVLVNGLSHGPRVSVSVTDASTRQSIPAVGCTLRGAIAALVKHDHAFAIDDVDLAFTGSKLTWTFKHNAVSTQDLFDGTFKRDPGKEVTINATTCAVTSK